MSFACAGDLVSLCGHTMFSDVILGLILMGLNVKEQKSMHDDCKNDFMN